MRLSPCSITAQLTQRPNSGRRLRNPGLQRPYWRKRHGLLLAVGLIALARWGFAQAPMVWRGLPPPAARHGAAMAYDSARGVAVLFGGGGYTTGYTTNFGDTWERDGIEWKEVSSNGPASRIDATLAYDSSRGVTVLFGGFDGSAYLGDTWEWNGIAWKQVSSGGPAARGDAAMTYDSVRGRTVLFGGKDSATVYGDTWEWNGTAWTQVADAGPGGLYDASMAFDSLRARTVLFGGSVDSAGTRSGTTWEWDGAEWQQITSTGPSARADASMAFDSARGVTALFGGNIGYVLSDTWEWNGTTWKKAAGSGPAPRKRAAMVYDSARNRILLFGGYGLNGNMPSLNDTWEWDGAAWTQQAASPRPSARRGSAVVYDGVRDRMVLFGGYGPGINTSGSWFGSDTWEWDASDWKQVSTSGPAGRAFASAAFDTARGRTVLFGGSSPDPGSLGDTWEWNGTEWQQFNTAGPPARGLASMVYDAARGKTVLFGGLGFNASGTYSTEYGDTWEWDGSTWTRVATTGPSPRYGVALAYDSARCRIVLFGGGLSIGYSYRDTWEWDGTVWKQVAKTGPIARSSASMVYDPARGKTFLFGGSNADSMLSLRDTWEWNGTVWRQTSMTGPISRYSASMVYDAARDRSLLFGGADANRYFGDMWEWAPSTNMGDALGALRRAAGLAVSDSASQHLYDVETDGTASSGVDIADAVRLSRRAIGLDQNP